MFNQKKYHGFLALFVAIAALFAFSAEVMAAKEPKVTVCHGDKSIRINGNAKQAHMNHGDLPGKCGEIVLSEWLDLRCESLPLSGVFAVSHVSGSSGLPTLVSEIGASENCAVAQKTIQDSLCRLAQDYGTPDAQAYVFNCPAETDVALPL